MIKTKSNMAAARYLRCSYSHYKKYAKNFFDEETGKSLFDLHKNESGKGIPKFLSNKGKEPPLKDLLEGRVSAAHFTPNKIKNRLIKEFLLENRCYCCGFTDERMTDHKKPLLMNFKDGDKMNYDLENLELLCYNCYFINIGDVLTKFQQKGIEDYTETLEKSFEWDVDGTHLDMLNDLGLDDDDDDEGSEYISRL